MDNYDGSITVENVTSSVKVNKTFGVIVKSFDERVSFNFSFEALPLTRLKYNDQVLTDRQVSPCSPATPWLSCLESTDIEVKLEKCQNRYPLKIDYEYDYNDEFYAALGTSLNRPKQHFIELFCMSSFRPRSLDPRSFVSAQTFSFLSDPPQMKQDSIELEFTNLTAIFKLECGVECGHPENFAYSWIKTSDPDTVLHTGAEYELNVQG